MLEKVARDVEPSKAKDDQRDLRIVPVYAEAHVPGALDPFVLQTWEETHRLVREVQELAAACAAPWAGDHPKQI